LSEQFPYKSIFTNLPSLATIFSLLDDVSYTEKITERLEKKFFNFKILQQSEKAFIANFVLLLTLSNTLETNYKIYKLLFTSFSDQNSSTWHLPLQGTKVSCG